MSGLKGQLAASLGILLRDAPPGDSEAVTFRRFHCEHYSRVDYLEEISAGLKAERQAPVHLKSAVLCGRFLAYLVEFEHEWGKRLEEQRIGYLTFFVERSRQGQRIMEVAARLVTPTEL